jgi:dipeptidyl aminopeptidase/acylaminoacyl peptidase
MAGMTPKDIGSLIGVDEVKLSPDGRQVAFAVWTVDLDENDYRRSIWLGPVDASSPAAPFTAGDPADSSPRWSPDGRWLAFVSDRKGDKTGAVVKVAPIGTGGEVRVVAEWDEAIDALEWSPGGSALAFGARTPDEDRGDKKAKDQPPRRLTRLFQRIDSVGWLHGRHRQLHVVPADGTARPVAVTSGEFETGSLSWLPDGRGLVFNSGRHDTWDLDLRDDIWTVEIGDAAAGTTEPRRVTATEHAWAWPTASPAGGRVAAIWFGSPMELHSGQLTVVELESGEHRSLTEKLDRPCHHFMVPQGPVWAGDDLLFLVEDHGNQHVYRVPGDGSAPPEPVIAGDRWVHAFDASADGDVIVAIVSTATTQPEVLAIDATGAERSLTALGRSFAGRVETSAPERFTARSADGTEVEAWYIAPVGAMAGQRYPTLLNVHGGPFTQYGNKFFDEFQIQAGAGFGVVYSNPRGSSGYGDAWGQAITWPTHPVHPGSGWGGRDAEDVMAVVDEAISRFDSIDTERLGVLGGSYGGYMTTWLVGHTDRFGAACSERAANDLVALDESSDIASAFVSETGQRFFANREQLAASSPITYATEITTPLLIIHSEGDLRCPIAQADALFTVLRVLERDVEMLRFPGASHELSRSGPPKQRVARAEAIVEWFERWLTAGSSPGSS